jgi:mannan endo-1,4-beta-mannosidase
MNKKLLFLLLLIGSLFAGCSSSRFANYITTNKDKLMDGEREFRFVSFNIPNLHYIEDYLAFDSSNPWRLPDEFEIRDALLSIKQLGGKVARIYVLSVRKQGESKNIIRHVEAPGVFNEEAFKALDKVMQIANETGVRVIIPLIDNWWWWGGPFEYAAFRGKNKEEFWTDPQLISDFKKTVEFIVNRRNTYTGVLYKEDKALFGWETGNELECPFSWTSEIASYIKSLDQNHVVIEGTHKQILTEEAISDTNIDVLSTHHYGNPDNSVKNILKNKELSKDKKPYFVGEFGLIQPQHIKYILDTTMSNDVSGIMIWSLRFHNRDGGFYMHRENTGLGSYRFPGFASGDPYSESDVINFMRAKAFEIDGMEIPPLEKPLSPNLLDIKDVYSINWQGSTGASAYDIERKETNSDVWINICKDIPDADEAYKPLFMDTTAMLGNEYYYRIIAKNESGSSEPSNEVGPVKVKSLKIIDEMTDESKIFMKEGSIEFVDFKDIYRAKEDHNRIKLDSSASIIYRVPENVMSFKVYAFINNTACGIKVLGADSLENFIPLTTKLKTFPPYKNVYKFFTPVLLTCEEFPLNIKYIKILCEEEAQLSQVEIEYNRNIVQQNNMVEK